MAESTKKRNIIRVGPVHAGVIEPGVFEFECRGERVEHATVELGYQRRGIEALIVEAAAAENPLRMMCLAEQIAGDSTIAHATAMAQLLEGEGGCPLIVKNERVVALEMERTAMNIADIAALSGDIAMVSTKVVCEAQRTLVVNAMQRLCGNRFGRTLIRPGGSHYRIDIKRCEDIKTTLASVAKRMKSVRHAMLSSPQVQSRFEEVCMVEENVGRFSGDLMSRLTARFDEIETSITEIETLTKRLAGWWFEEYDTAMEAVSLPANATLSSKVMGYRGVVRHKCRTDAEGKIIEYSITDPSTKLWQVLMRSMAGQALSDFPLNNKSFNLSYSAADK